MIFEEDLYVSFNMGLFPQFFFKLILKLMKYNAEHDIILEIFRKIL